ncbi:MAG: MATE family efflux transporter, partial [Christensenellales bacterium]
MNAQERMARGPVWRLFLSMSLPAITVMLVMVIYNMADVYFIGRAGDTAQVAALALTGPVFGAIQGLGTLLGSGGCTAAALALGGGDDCALNAVTSFCFWGALTVGAALAVVGALFAPEVCALLGAGAATAEYAVRYVRVLSLGTPCVLMAGVLSNVVRAGGSTREAMLGNGLGTVINVALDPLLIEVLGMGVEGAALATVIGNAAGCALLIMYIVR